MSLPVVLTLDGRALALPLDVVVRVAADAGPGTGRHAEPPCVGVVLDARGAVVAEFPATLDDVCAGDAGTAEAAVRARAERHRAQLLDRVAAAGAPAAADRTSYLDRRALAVLGGVAGAAILALAIVVSSPPRPEVLDVTDSPASSGHFLTAPSPGAQAAVVARQRFLEQAFADCAALPTPADRGRCERTAQDVAARPRDDPAASPSPPRP